MASPPRRRERCAPKPAAPPVDLVLFYGQGCPHCAALRAYLATIQEAHPRLQIHEFEVYFNDDNARLFQQLAAAYHREVEGVPTVFLGERVVVGYSESMQPGLAAMIAACETDGCASPLTHFSAGAAPAPGALPDSPPPTLTLGAVVVAAVVDAINPCAFAVLVLLIGAVLVAGNRRRALYAGLAFSASIFISYYLMGVGLYSAVAAAGVTQALYVAVGVLAVLIGLFNLKDFLWYGRWFVMEVPLAWRPALKRLMGGVTSVPGAFAIGFLVSLFLLPCTSGPYIVILGLLARTATRPEALLWLVLYNAIFILPMLVITGAIYAGYTTAARVEKWRTGNLRTLHLIAGLILLALGAWMLWAWWTGWV